MPLTKYLGWGCACLISASLVGAQEQTEPPPEATPASKLHGFQADDFTDPLEPLQPKTPRTEADLKQISGSAWWAAGQLLENRGDNPGAYEAYKKGFAENPQSLSIVRKLTAMAFALEDPEAGLMYAQKAIELDPSDLRLLRKVAAVLVADDPAKALELLEKAAQRPDIDKQTPLYVSLMRDLGLLYKALDRPKDAATCLAVVFDALQNHEKYDLTSRMRKELQADPELDPEKLGEVFLAADQPELALQAFQRAKELKRGGQGHYEYNMAQLYLQTKKPAEALAELQKYLDSQRQTKGREAYELFAKILTALGRSSDVLAEVEELAKKDPKNTTLQVYLADQYVAAERYADAEPLYKEAIRKDTDIAGYRGLATLYRKQNRPSELIATLAQALEKQGNLEAIRPELETILADPGLLKAVLEEGRKQASADPPELRYTGAYMLARLASQGKAYDIIGDFYRLAIKQRKAAAQGLYDEWGDTLLDAQQFAEAAKVFSKAAEDPDLINFRPNYLVNLARALEFDGKTDEALDAIKRAKEGVPDHPLIGFQEAWIHYHAGKYDEAIPLFEQLVRKFPQNKTLVRFCRSSLSNIYVLKGDVKKGEAILEEMFKDEPDDPGINNDLGYLWADQGKNLEQAESMIRKALKKEPDNAAYLDSIAWVLYKRGKPEEAVGYLEKAVKKATGSDSTLWDHLGDIYEKLKQPEKAVAAWQKALASAKEEARQDAKLISRIEEKLKSHTPQSGQPKAEGTQSP